MDILVIDIGGKKVKLRVEGSTQTRKFPSGPDLTPERLLQGLAEATADWSFNRVTIGFPAPVIRGCIRSEPVNLGQGWMGFDFAAALQRPVRVLNDAAMQALGSYEGGRMLFLGLGTGLGSAMVLDGVLAPMELGHLPYKKGDTFEAHVGEAGLQRLGRQRWQETVFDVVKRLQDALLVDYLVLGGGNAKKLSELPPGCRQGSNENAFIGGVRVWDRQED